MSRRRASLRGGLTGVVRWVALSAGVLAVAGLAVGDELPTLRRGMWEFNRTIQDPTKPGSPQRVSNRQCTDPTEDMKKQNAMPGKYCRFSPITRSGNAYTFSATCELPGGMKGTSKSVLTFKSDSAYTVHVESEGMDPARSARTREDLVATRVGDCAG